MEEKKQKMKYKKLNKIQVYYKKFSSKKYVKGILEDEGDNWIFQPEEKDYIIYNPSLSDLYIEKEK